MGNNSNLINEKYKTPAKIMRVLTTGGNKDRTGRIHNPETRRITIPGGHKKTLQQGDFASKRARNMLDAANLAKAYRRKNLGMKIQKHLESILFESFMTKIFGTPRGGQPELDHELAARDKNEYKRLGSERNKRLSFTQRLFGAPEGQARPWSSNYRTLGSHIGHKRAGSYGPYDEKQRQKDQRPPSFLKRLFGVHAPDPKKRRSVHWESSSIEIFGKKIIESFNSMLMEARGDTLAARYEKKTGRPFPEDLNVPKRGEKAGPRIKAAVRIARGK